MMQKRESAWLDLSELLSKGGFHLAKWLSTCNSIMESIAVEERAKVKDMIDLIRDVSERVLGMKWYVGDDCFAYKVTWPEMPAIRRGLLSGYSSLFDPLGLVAPFVLEASLIFEVFLCKDQDGTILFPKMK